jgi:hypothetical protein
MKKPSPEFHQTGFAHCFLDGRHWPRETGGLSTPGNAAQSQAAANDLTPSLLRKITMNHAYKDGTL